MTADQLVTEARANRNLDYRPYSIEQAADALRLALELLLTGVNYDEHRASQAAICRSMPCRDGCVG
jgi:hypothetical protein